MIGEFDSYYSRSEVSNSDLSELEKDLYSPEDLRDATAAYRFGNLIDALITEPERCNHYTFKVDQEQFTREEWEIATKMLNAFRDDKTCAQFLKMGIGQKMVNHDRFEIDYEGFTFALSVRCKFDLWLKLLNWGCDIKSTTATTQAQFEAAILHFNYDRQRAWYMDLAGSDQDMLIGISKNNFKVFKVPIRRGDSLYNSGKIKYQHLAFKHWVLYDGFFDVPSELDLLIAPQRKVNRMLSEMEIREFENMKPSLD